MPRLPLAVLLTISQLSCGDFLRPDRMYRKVIGNKDALCNDGSSAVYYIGVRDPARWVIFLESGSYCLTREQCEERFGSKDTNILMTSRGMPEVTIGRDLLSVNSQENKLFHSYSGILIPYCSSDSWMGTQTKSQLPDLRLGLSAKKFIFSGKIIFQSVIYEFLGQFSKEVREIVFAGSSAGAVAVLNHMQWVQSLLSSKNISTKLSAIVDGGWFINFRESIMSKLTSEFFNISKPMSRACADFSNGYPCCLSAPCMLAQGYYPDNVPTFFVSSMFDIYIIGDVVLQQLEDRTTFVESGGGDIITLLDLYGGAMNQSLTVVRSPNVSFFVPACFQHTFFSMSGLRDKGGVLHYDKMFSQGNAVFSTSKEHRRWLSLAIRQGKRIVTLQSALFKWAQTHQPVKMIENCLGALCNPTCPEKLMFVDTAVQWSEDLVTLLGLVSLVPTVLCVALRTTFYIQSLLVSRAQKESLRGSKSPEDKIWIPVEPVRLHYSTPDRFQHYYSEVRRQKTGRYTNAEENKMTHDYTSKGCNIFYSTAEYVRAAIGARNKVYPANDTARRFYSEDSDVYSGDWRTTNASNVELGVGRPLNYQDVRDERLNMADAVCKKGVDNADLTFKDGEMIAVLGKSGAGKTTLLHLLCGEFACGCGQGHLTVNGVKQEKLPSRVRNLGNVARLSWFARLGDLTVREHLTLSALMTTAGNMCNIVERVEQIIRETRLDTVADQAVNGTDKIHLTELQKRLFGVALQLATRPLVILLDDPITGLNHESTLDLLDIIRRISDRGHLVVATMESIPKEAAQRFDQIVLLDDKQIVYSGSPTTLAQRYNQLTRDSPDKEKMPLEGVIGDILQDKKVMLLMVDEQSRNKVREKVATHPSRKEKNSPQTREMGGLLARLFVIDYRASLPRSLGESLFLPVVFTMIGITAGIVYWQTDTPLRILTAYSGSSIPSLLFLCSFVFNRVTRCLETCRQGPAEIVGYSHEHVTQTFTSLTAECVLPVLICATLTYFMVMPSYNLQRFVLVTNISLVLNQTWIAVYMLITFANPSNACHAGFMVAALAGFSAGFVVTRLEMPFGYNFLFYVNPQYYGYSAISKALLKDTRLYCDYESFFNCISQDGNAVLAKFAFDSVNPHQHMMIMLGITLLCLLFSWLLCDARSSR